MNNIALLVHNISTMAVDPHCLAEQAVDVLKTAGVILCLCSTGAVAAARTAAWQHLIQRNLWLQQTPGIPEPMRRQLLECPISPDVLFRSRLSSLVDDMQAASEEAEKFRRQISRPPPPPGRQCSAPGPRRRHRPPTVTVAAPPAAPPPGPQAYQPRPPPSQAAASGQQRQLRGEGEACDSEKHLFSKDGCFFPTQLTPEPTGSAITVVNKLCIIDGAIPTLISPHHVMPGMTRGETAAKTSSLSTNDTQLVHSVSSLLPSHSVIPPRVPTLRREEATL